MTSAICCCYSKSWSHLFDSLFRVWLSSKLRSRSIFTDQITIAFQRIFYILFGFSIGSDVCDCENGAAFKSSRQTELRSRNCIYMFSKRKQFMNESKNLRTERMARTKTHFWVHPFLASTVHERSLLPVWLSEYFFWNELKSTNFMYVLRNGSKVGCHRQEIKKVVIFLLFLAHLYRITLEHKLIVLIVRHQAHKTTNRFDSSISEHINSNVC